LEVYRLANATAAAAEQDCDTRASANSVTFGLIDEAGHASLVTGHFF
jgi:hypothetical protein